MAATPTVASSGTQTAVVNTEHTLYDSAAAGVFEYEVDMSNLAAGDTVELRAYKMVLTSGTRRVFLLKRVSGAQPSDDLIASTITVSTGLSDSGAVRFTLKQTAGTGRNFPWAITQF